MKKEPKKMGRPAKNINPRTERLSLRVSPDEVTDIECCADRLGVSRTDAIIEGINRLKKELEDEEKI